METGGDRDTATLGISERLEAQLREARADLDRARTELDIMLGELIGDLHSNLGAYVVENVKREIRKRPEHLDRIDQQKLGQLRDELEQVSREESARIVENIRNTPEWYDTDVVFLESRAGVWKTIQSVDAPVNRVTKKYGIPPIVLRNWNWLGDHLSELAEKRYPSAKRIFIEKTKLVDYLQARLKDETAAAAALVRLDEL